MNSEGVTVTGAEEPPGFALLVVCYEVVIFSLQNWHEIGIYSYGFEKPSAIQQRGIKPILDGRDTIGQAHQICKLRGTGKTATFVIGALQRIDYSMNRCQALMLAPTREGIGGTAIKDDVDRLRAGQHMVVGTPGRVFDMVNKSLDQIYDIFKCLPPDVQVCLFSATMAPEILDMTSKFMRNAVRILVKKDRCEFRSGSSRVLISTDLLARGIDVQQARVGNTPCVKLNDRLAPKGRTIYVKLEYFNPLGTTATSKSGQVPAFRRQAEKNNRLKPGDTVIEATSGNTGIALAMFCAQRGYKCVLVMAEPFSVERRKLMRFLGARVIITPRSAKGSGMVAKAQELAQEHGWLLCQQFETPANSKIHYETTGQEIINDFQGNNAGTRLDYFVTGYGTGGTYAGAGKALREKRPEVKLCLAEPADAALVASGHKMERRVMIIGNGSAIGSHPAFRPHPIQGWTPDFLAKVAEDGLKELSYDEYVPIPSGGISGGASTWAAIEIAKKAPEGSAPWLWPVILAMIADTAERYLSTPLFSQISPDMNEALISGRANQMKQ
eukprot:Skav219878  [mRNA]  locus=scaffold777:284437:304008:+ [translate_table: standard]